MDKIQLLWADDEIDLLKPHLIFLQEKGYKVQTVNNGQDALDFFKENHVDLVFLDENMPGIGGLDVLSDMKSIRPEVPVVMVTKSEEEHLMEEAIGSRIADYLIKPVHPNQLLLSIKKNLDQRRIVNERSTQNYLQEFREIGMQIGDKLSIEEWFEVYRKLVFWEMEMAGARNHAMLDILQSQKEEANTQFVRFIKENYLGWIQGKSEAPLMSHHMFKQKVAPLLKSASGQPVFWVVIDNLRYDQWKTLQPILTDFSRVKEESMACAILPTATHFARNAMFAGLMPSDIKKLHPNFWVDEDEEGGKNMHEEGLLLEQITRLGLKKKVSYHKITNLQSGRKLAENLSNLKHNDLNVVVYNFVDMLSHARTDMEVIRELADDEEAYRSLTKSWFNNSPLLDILRGAFDMNAQVVIATDHGTIRVKEPVQVVGDRNTTTNLRYKQGRNLRYNPSEVFEIEKPEEAHLPRINVSTKYIFATGSDFFAYPNNYNYYVNFYRNTFQHGGVSLEEMLVPYVHLSPKS